MGYLCSTGPVSWEPNLNGHRCPKSWAVRCRLEPDAANPKNGAWLSRQAPVSNPKPASFLTGHRAFHCKFSSRLPCSQLHLQATHGCVQLTVVPLRVHVWTCQSAAVFRSPRLQENLPLRAEQGRCCPAWATENGPDPQFRRVDLRHREAQQGEYRFSGERSEPKPIGRLRGCERSGPTPIALKPFTLCALYSPQQPSMPKPKKNPLDALS